MRMGPFSLQPEGLGDSQPFLKIAREFELDYGDVLSYADLLCGRGANGYWKQKGADAVLKHPLESVITRLVLQLCLKYQTVRTLGEEPPMPMVSSPPSIVMTAVEFEKLLREAPDRMRESMRGEYEAFRAEQLEQLLPLSPDLRLVPRYPVDVPSYPPNWPSVFYGDKAGSGG